ncbi:aldehyde dehydrogenase family protein [Pseudozobellia thermophila]|uniref:Succinate-semialdehyde dehydrogenase / glutarate-semialdehyde dehydrogenase n=1 Tax=Pseudozobellia thermophila TaxID=192903 RepID=A0A1M6GMV1_9FLAO|nr:aldehyde dehydrogenase family protein [Pseudozobellia thermophila]SHJ11249.1 succinate-semialdehyde dehydrogenase / glutarate-semialdehyde dehydrogenase [Pseudozobellia thermophila]
MKEIKVNGNLKFGHKNLYFDGELKAALNDKKFEVISPATEKAVATISWADISDTQKTLESARQGFEFWSKLPLEKRLEWIDKLRNKILENAELLRESIMYEMGKTWAGTLEDLTSITDSLQFYSQEIKKRTDLVIDDREGSHEHKVISQPLGVVVAFLAYNFPLLNLGFKLGPALAAGCSIVIKPSEYSPLSAYILGELCHEINFPKGVINIICGDTENVGIPLCESKIPQLITMIGSTETAKKLIVQSSRTSIKRFSMECGGNAPFIVFPDASLDDAVSIAKALKTGNSGQICVAPNRLFVHRDIIEPFAEKLVALFEKTKVGFGTDQHWDMGPLANRMSVEKIEDIVGEARDQGGKVLCGGHPISGTGYYFEPTVILLNDSKAKVLQKEIFGPVAILVPFSSKEEALRLSNETDAGLASYLFTEDAQVQQYFIERLEFGEVQINGVKYDIYLPHGGIKNSGIGVDCSSFALDDYLIRKRVSKAIPEL